MKIIPNYHKIYLVGGIIWLVYFIYIYTHVSGVPFVDDYDIYLGSIKQYNEASGLKNKLISIFNQHNEHRPAIPRLIALLVTFFWGYCNLKILIIIGNVFLLCTWIIITKNISINNGFYKFLTSVGILFVLIGFQSIENMFWATGSVQNYLSILLTVLCFHYLLKKKEHFAFICFLLSVCNSMTAFILVPFILFSIIKHKKYLLLLTIVILASVVTLLYFYNYQKPPHFQLFNSSENKTLQVKTTYFFTFLGSFFAMNGNNLQISFIGGLLLILLFLSLNINYNKWNFWTYLGAFIILSGMAAVFSRSVFGIEQAVSGRYRILSGLLILSCIMKIIHHPFYNKRIFIISFATTSGLLFFIQALHFHSIIIANKKFLNDGMMIFIATKNPSLLQYPSPPAAAAKLIESYELGIYKPEF